jgi:hypothetical protein
VIGKKSVRRVSSEPGRKESVSDDLAKAASTITVPGGSECEAARVWAWRSRLRLGGSTVADSCTL